jgi:5-methylcytosine-specific restriction endonuclease McrA
MARKPLKSRPYGSGRLTEAGFWQFIRSALREKSRRWWPIHEVLKQARRPSRSKNKRLKWEFQCAECQKWFPQKQVSVDHLVPCGRLSSFEDLPGFVKRLFVEKDGLQVLCHDCHDQKTKEDAQKKVENDSYSN